MCEGMHVYVCLCVSVCQTALISKSQSVMFPHAAIKGCRGDWKCCLSASSESSFHRDEAEAHVSNSCTALCHICMCCGRLEKSVSALTRQIATSVPYAHQTIITNSVMFLCLPQFLSAHIYFQYHSSGTSHIIPSFYFLRLLGPSIIPLFPPSCSAYTQMFPSGQMGCVSTLWTLGRTAASYLCSKTEQRAFRGHVMSQHIIGSFIILSYCDRANNHLRMIPRECKVTASSSAFQLWMKVR